MPTINLQEIDKPAGAAAAVSVLLQGFKAGDSIEITFWEDDTQDSLIPSTERKSVQKIGVVEGEVVLFLARPGLSPVFTLMPRKVTPVVKSSLKFIVAFAQPAGAPAKNVEFFLPAEKVDVFEGESWEVFATVEGAQADSPTTRLARVRRALSVQKGESTYSHYVGHFCRFHHDGHQRGGGYFQELLIALREAVDFIFIADWSFHPHMRLTHTGSYDLDSTIGAILIAQALKQPEMVIAINTWDHFNLAVPDDQNDNGGDELDRIAQVHFKLKSRPKNLLWQKSALRVGFSHHQKFVVMDSPLDGVEGRRRIRAFLGGLDLTKGRFDTGTHPILPGDSASAPFQEALAYVRGGVHVYDDWYNAEFFSLDPVNKPPKLPRQPWHDIAVHITGPACWDIVREFTGRWRRSASGGDADVVEKKYIELLNRTKDPAKPHHPKVNPLVYSQQWHPAGGPWAAQLYRSITRNQWEADPPLVIQMADRKRNEFKWTYNGSYEASIQRAYFQAVRQAEHFVYIETQYFISSGSMWQRPSVSNVVAINLAMRAIEQSKKGVPFHIYIVLPMFPEGKPGDASNCAQRQFQWRTIQAMARMIEAQGRKPGELMSVFFLAKWHDLGGALPNVGGTREQNVVANRRYPIYVHSKFMLIDDRYMIIGSANLNERSLNGGRDSEIALGLWPSDDSTIKTCIEEAREFRRRIWAEHLGPAFPPADFDNPGSAACVNAVRAAAANNYIAFREGRHDSTVHGHLCLWPFESGSDTEPMRSVSKAPELDGLIPDRPFGLSGQALDAWRWHAPGEWSYIIDFTDPDEKTAE